MIFTATRHILWAPNYTRNAFAARALPQTLLGSLQCSQSGLCDLKQLLCSEGKDREMGRYGTEERRESTQHPRK